MPWLDPIEWAPPAGFPAGMTPAMVWTGVDTFALVWISYEVGICRNDFAVNLEAGTITDTGFQSYPADDMADRYVEHAAISPSGALVLEVRTVSGG